MKVAMMQPTFLPWPGFFGLIGTCDRFVFGDDFQFSAGSFHQRNPVFRNLGEIAWMTVPMQKKKSKGLPLNEAQIAEFPPWRKQMWKRISNVYRSAPFYAEVAPVVEPWLLAPAASLAEQNMNFIRLACEMMGLKREFRLSSQRNTGLPRSHRVVDLLRWCEATVYLCARGSFHYMEHDGVFPVDGVEVRFQYFLPPAYPQSAARGKFVPYLSVLDMLFNVGPAAARELIEENSTKWLSWDEMVVSCGPVPEVEQEPCEENV
jgi:hypothetical protein